MPKQNESQVGANQALQAGGCRGSSGRNPLSVPDPKALQRGSAGASRSDFISQSGLVKNNPPLSEFVPVTQVPSMLPPGPNGSPISLTTVYRWIDAGLPTIDIGGRKHTHPDWLVGYFNHGNTIASMTNRTPAARKRAASSANRQLEMAGL